MTIQNNIASTSTTGKWENKSKDKNKEYTLSLSSVMEYIPV